MAPKIPVRNAHCWRVVEAHPDTVQHCKRPEQHVDAGGEGAGNKRDGADHRAGHGHRSVAHTVDQVPHRRTKEHGDAVCQGCNPSWNTKATF